MPTDQFDSMTGHAARHDALDAAIAAPTFVGATAPASPAQGATWLDTSGTPTLKVWVSGSPGSWVTAGGGVGGSADGITYDGTASGLAATDVQAAIDELESEKQDALVSGTNIRTVNGNTLLGSTDLAIGLTKFTESVNASAPNATVPVVQLLATDAATNVDVALTPKGTGALLAQIPDNTATGGNKRGQASTDLQKTRNAATQVASGTDSFIGCGIRNTASGAQSGVVAGSTNISSGTQCGVLSGNNNTASNSASAVVAGASNSASGNNAIVGAGLANLATNTNSGVLCGISNQATGVRAGVLCGESNTASGESSWIPGGVQSSTRSLFAAYSWSGARRSSNFDNQCIGMTVQGTTTNATPTIITADRAAASATNVMVLPNNSSFTGKVHITARESVNGHQYDLYLHVVGARGASAATTTVKATNPDYTYTDPALTGVSATVVANTTRGSLEVQVTGLASTTIDWFAHYIHGNQIAR